MKTVTHSAGKWLFAMIIITYPLHLATASIIYVDANATAGAHNGTSWANAYQYLQDANAVTSGNSIYVAQGTYKPDRDKRRPTGTGSRTATFQLKSGVALYGGFPTGGGSRDPNIHPTILSGDLTGNDANVPDPCNLLTEPTRAENSYNVVNGSYTDATAILDGFTITAGNANSSVWPSNMGGGMLNISSSCTVNNCTFIENSSVEDGGGMWNFLATCTVNNCTFIENSSGTTGGGIGNSQSDSYISNCTFLRNAAFYGGGGINFYLYLSNHPVVVNCSFISNKGFGTGNNAGGLYNNESNAEVNNCSFINNYAMYGGGLSNINGSCPTITNCTFSGNSALSGGGMNNDNGSPTVTNCTFSGNSSDSYGGLSSGNGSNVTLINCTFSGNSAPYGSNIGTYSNGVIYLGGSSRIQGMGIGLVWGLNNINLPLGGEIVIDSNAVVDLNDPNDPNIKDAIWCAGLLKVQGNGQLKHAAVVVGREEGGYFGKFQVEGSAQATNLDIYADGDRYMDVDPCTFTGTIANNRIYVNITESDGLLELRGQNLASPPCDFNDPTVLACQLDSNIMPAFDTNSWTLEQLEVQPGAKVTLVNRFNNGNGNPEVLYVKNLVLDSCDVNSVLNVGFEHLYYTNLNDLHPSSIKKGGLLGFSLNKINFDSAAEFQSRVSNNNSADPNNTMIRVELVTGQAPDPNGFMAMHNLKDVNGQMTFARAKGAYAPAVEDRIRIQFNYLFSTTDPNVQIVVYLADVPEMLDHNDPCRADHYIEVGRVSAPPSPRPGSADSNRFGNFDKFVSTGGLDLSKGTWVELEMNEPVSGSGLLAYSYDKEMRLMSLETLEDLSVIIAKWDAGIYCGWDGICIDLNFDNVVDVLDFLAVVGGAGSTELSTSICAEGIFSNDGYADKYDMVSWDWTLNSDKRENFCGGVPLSVGAKSLAASGLGSSDEHLNFSNSPNLLNLSGLSDLLISGKMGTTARQTRLEDGLYVFDSSYHYSQSLSPTSDRCNIKVVRGIGSDLYQINSESGVSQLDNPNIQIVPPGSVPYDANEPRYNLPATVYAGIYGTASVPYGRPIIDAAFDANNYVYVVPVVVVPVGNEPNTYTAAAKLQLNPYLVVELYDEPNLLPNDNQREYRNNLRDIGLDAAGNVYVTNANTMNESDILWKFEPSGVVCRLDLGNPNSPLFLPAPVGMCVSSSTNMLYLASSLSNDADYDTTVIYGLSTATLAPVRTITVSGMQHITSITEDPITNSLWVTGFNFNSLMPQDPYSCNKYNYIDNLPFYDPYLANVPYGVNNVNAVCILGAGDLAMPLSICWTGALPPECGGADLNKNGTVNLEDLAVLASHWLETDCSASNNYCEGADLEPLGSRDGTVNLKDLDVMADHWLETNCQQS